MLNVIMMINLERHVIFDDLGNKKVNRFFFPLDYFFEDSNSNLVKYKI